MDNRSLVDTAVEQSQSGQLWLANMIQKPIESTELSNMLGSIDRGVYDCKCLSTQTDESVCRRRSLSKSAKAADLTLRVYRAGRDLQPKARALGIVVL